MSGSGGLERTKDRLPLDGAGKRTVLVSTVASDAHTWNLVFLQLLIEELGFDVVNLGPCVPDELLIAETLAYEPVMVVISSVNGHGYQDGLRVIAKLRADERLRTVPVVIGGKLGVGEDDCATRITDLVAAGFDAVFDDRVAGPAAFRSFVAQLSAPAAIGHGGQGMAS